MGKRKAGEDILIIPGTEVNELPVPRTDSGETIECEFGSEETTDHVLGGASLGSEELSRPVESRVGDQLDMPTVLTSEEGVVAIDGVTIVAGEESEDDVEPYTFWQLLELAGYEFW